MADEKRYSVEESARKLHLGISTLRLWHHIYSEFLTLPGEESLSRGDMGLFTYISECTESGLTREEIHQALRNRAANRGDLFPPSAFRKETAEEEAEILSLVDEENPTSALLARLVIQQQRLTKVEERKACALEKRLTIAEETSQTLAAILTTLTASGLPQSVPAHPVEESPMDEPPMDEPPMDEATDAPMDDLNALVDEPRDEPMDDLSALVDEPRDEPMDDLSALVDEPRDEPMDDLSALVDEPRDEPMDDLSALVDEPRDEPMDDLNALVDNKAPRPEGMDRLWDLVDEEPETNIPPAHQVSEAKGPAEVDKLSDRLDEPQETKKPMSNTGLDDLWDSPPDPDKGSSPPPSSPKPVPERASAPLKKETVPTDPQRYKDFILKEIIGMKRREGLSAADVADRLNAEAKPTFSGKGKWGTRTIQGIFQIIEKAGMG